MLEQMPESQRLFIERLTKHHDLFLRAYHRQLSRYHQLLGNGLHRSGYSRRRTAHSFLHLCLSHLAHPDAWTMNLIFELYGLDYEVRCNDAGRLVIRSTGVYPEPASS